MMNRKTGLLLIAGIVASAVGLERTALAFDLDVDVDLHGKRRERVVQPPPRLVRRWVPDQVVRREERVLVEPARIEQREERVLVEPARVEKRRVKVLVRAAHVERRWVSTERREEVRIGPVRVGRTTPSGYWEEVQVPAQYEIIEQEILVPARYQTVVREVELSPRYRVVARDVLIPGHWEDTEVLPPPVVEERRDGLKIDLDLHKHRH
jgi:hypothetical protein